MKNIKPHRYIDKQRKFIYWKNPKAACSSILQILRDNNIINNDNLHGKQNILSEGWANAWRHYDYFQFSFVRNPWDRFVSLYLDKTKRVVGTKWEMREWKKYSNHTFEQFAEAMYKRGVNNIDRHSRCQFLNLNRLNGINYVGKVENFDKNMATVAKKLNLENLTLHKINQTEERKPYQEYYNDKTVNLVGDIYRKDIKIFKYKYVEL